jgi:hypothetical protein
LSGGTRLEGRQRWNRLLFLHWALPPEIVRPTVPDELPLDLHDGKAWVGLVAFDVAGARPPLLPGALGIDFLETNTRTYVRLPGGDPAVWFYALDASSKIAVEGARLAYGLPYWRAEMSRASDGGSELYHTTRDELGPAELEVRYRTGEPLGTAAPGSLEEFLIERYVLHTVDGGEIGTVRVRHEPYPLREVEVEAWREGLLAAAGLQRPGDPPLAHFADGVDVEVHRVLGDGQVP